MKNRKFVTVSLATALAIGTITANGVLVSADAEKGTIKVAASATPHAEILEEAKPILEKEGWDLEVTVFDDYVQPNLVVESGDFDANYFQHIPYLEATVKDIEENPKNIQIEELEAAQVSRVKDEVAFVVLNGNYALQAGYSVSKDSIAHETSDSEAAKTYVNIIAVKEGNEDNEAVKALVDVLKSDEIKDYINETYDGAVVPFEESADSDKAEAVDATADAEEDTAAKDAE